MEVTDSGSIHNRLHLSRTIHIWHTVSEPRTLEISGIESRIAVNSCRLSRFWTPVRTRTLVYSKTVTFGIAAIVTGRIAERKEGYIGRQCGAAMESTCYPEDTQKVIVHWRPTWRSRGQFLLHWRPTWGRHQRQPISVTISLLNAGSSSEKTDLLCSEKICLVVSKLYCIVFCL